MYNVKVIFNNTLGWSKVVAVFTKTDDIKKIEMTFVKNTLYFCFINDIYDDVCFTDECNVCTVHMSFNNCVSSFEPNGYEFNGVVCLQPYEESYITSTKTVAAKFKLKSGSEKEIYIWTPKDYYKNSATQKYGVVYMFDGQNLFDKNSTSYGSWNVPQIMNIRGDYIVVGINNGDIYRNSQLTPNIGRTRPCYEKQFSNSMGIQFAEFIVNTIIPYINKNYNVFADKYHTSVCGSSSGGLESFYMGMTYSDIFGVVGALSPAFALYDDNVWNVFLQSVDIKNAPTIYLYTGENDLVEKELYPQIESMLTLLKKNGYDTNKLVYDYKKYNNHNEACWSGAFVKFASLLN